MSHFIRLYVHFSGVCECFCHCIIHIESNMMIESYSLSSFFFILLKNLKVSIAFISDVKAIWSFHFVPICDSWKFAPKFIDENGCTSAFVHCAIYKQNRLGFECGICSSRCSIDNKRESWHSNCIGTYLQKKRNYFGYTLISCVVFYFFVIVNGGFDKSQRFMMFCYYFTSHCFILARALAFIMTYLHFFVFFFSEKRC